MILKGSQRGGARQLAVHLLKPENEQIELIELRGFIASDLPGAFDEARAIAKGTKCQQFLFSLSLNPPLDQVVGDVGFMKTADDIEARLGLAGQPRAIVVHEKEGRRHAHAVWSRIDAQTMTAKPLPFFKNRLRDMSRDLYLEHGWSLPNGLRDPLLKNPLNFTREEWQQARRTDRDPREIKQVMQEAWARSDGQKAFAAALEQSGFVLAKGDRRGHVAIDHMGEVYSLSRWTGIKTKDLRIRIGPPDNLLSVDEAKDRMQKALTPKLETFRQEQATAHRDERATFVARKNEIAARHGHARETLKEMQTARHVSETRYRAARLRGGVAGLWDKLTGRAHTVIKRNQAEAWSSLKRDQAEKGNLIVNQLAERRAFQAQVTTLRDRQRDERQALDQDVGRAIGIDEASHIAQERARAFLNRNRLRSGPSLYR